MGLATAGPAAALTGAWRAYGNTNPISSSGSIWACSHTTTITTDVYAQVCAVRAPGTDSRQAAVIVRNDRSSLYSVRVAVTQQTIEGSVGQWECQSSGVGAHSWSVCFGTTLYLPFDPASAYGTANGVDLGLSSWN